MHLTLEDRFRDMFVAASRVVVAGGVKLCLEELLPAASRSLSRVNAPSSGPADYHPFTSTLADERARAGPPWRWASHPSGAHKRGEENKDAGDAGDEDEEGAPVKKKAKVGGAGCLGPDQWGHL